MVDNAEMQAGASRTKGGRKGKVSQLRATDNEVTNKTEVEVIDDDEETGSNSNQDSSGKQYNFHTLAKLLELVPKLTSQNYYSWNVHIKSFL